MQHTKASLLPKLSVSSSQNKKLVLPNFFIAGAAKSGTTSLHDYLSQHHQIFMSKHKEPHFFALDWRYQQGLDSYAALFSAGIDYKVRGESSTGYMVFPHVVERIKVSITEARFIFILRNPVDRAYSHYWWLRALGYEKKEFKAAFIADKDEIPDSDKNMNGNYKYYYQYGCYGKYLKRYIDAFGLDAILILTTEQLKKNPLETVNLCCEFLEVEKFKSLAPIESNKTEVIKFARLHRLLYSWLNSPKLDKIARKTSLRGAKRVLSLARWYLDKTSEKLLSKPYPKMNADTRQWLANFYWEEVEVLRKISGRNFSEWFVDFPP